MVRTGSPIVSSDTEILVATASLEGMKSELMEDGGQSPTYQRGERATMSLAVTKTC